MKAFRFRLERVLRLTGQRLRQEIRTLQLARLEESARQSERDRIAGRLDEVRAEIGRQGSVSVGEWRLNDRYQQELRARLARAEEALAEAEAQVEAARSQVLEHNREKKALERLKARQAERHAEESARRQQTELDEFSLISRLPG